MQLLSPDEGRFALSYAREAILMHLTGKRIAEPVWPEIFSRNRGVFVTLTLNGELRGCIGYPYPHVPLSQALHDVACSAATTDPRFPPVQPGEMNLITVEVTVLTEPVLLTAYPDQRESMITVGRHGLIVTGSGRSGLLLPQVAVEWNWNSREFLDHTCIKAGLPAKSWLESSVQVFTFEGQIFSEKSD